MTNLSNIKKEELQEIIYFSKSYSEVLTKLKYNSNNGGAFKKLKKLIEKYNLDVRSLNLPSKSLVTCNQCNKAFYKYIKEQKKTKNNFCSQSCAATYNNTHKTKGTRVSKLELYLQEQLKQKYNYDFHFNRKDTINSELDIYIPELKLAFELNGIFHYEPIFGEEKLNQIQNNDNRKFQACLERRISLCIIDTSWIKYNKVSNFNKILDIIKNVISNAIRRNRTSDLLPPR